ncbi:Lrp/AsnC family transcriptional regulator [Agromyces archimandritae]|uniref:Lrp/AsnC family transcriptional regulator n=1 Tax=Agromyces archimandritae TaxID=2781962 RepID=A0A975FQK8_9MICO|nr:Lrp/AsnC family transcriptional regulator [Agromyces archimandritae]QTX05401.1 Lrp/AsnC family transcriptional regulator [Agromyces archimandritae]
MPIDRLDARLIALFADEPRIGVYEASRRLGVARGTVQARLDRLMRSGVVTGFGPDVDAAALGYPVTTYLEIEISQGERTSGMVDELRAIPEVIEAHTITGRADLLVRVVARSNTDLQRVVDRIVRVPGIERTSTLVVLSTPIPSRMRPLVEAAPEG